MNFKPHREQNAIARVAFVCEFSQPIGDEALRAVYGLHAHLAMQLPKASLNRGFTLHFGQGIPTSAIPTPEIGSVAFEEFSRSGDLLHAFQAHPNVFVFINQDYTRWADVWTKARGILLAALGTVPGSLIKAFGLEYADRFTAPATGHVIDVTQLLSRESQYLAPRVFASPGVWHSHYGSLSNDDSEPRSHGKNDNINIELVKEQTPLDQYAVNMVLRHRRILDDPIDTRDASGLLDEFMVEMHLTDKIVMRDLLTAEAARRIGLDMDDADNKPD